MDALYISKYSSVQESYMNITKSYVAACQCMMLFLLGVMKFCSPPILQKVVWRVLFTAGGAAAAGFSMRLAFVFFATLIM